MTGVAVIAFFFALGAGLLIQFIVLPIFLPGIHGGNGLLLSSDSAGYHRLAVELAARIHAEGWEAWELRPRGQAPAGVAAILYCLLLPSPWVLLPLNAALFSLAAVLIFSMIYQTVINRSIAFFFGLAFIATPSAAMFYSQISKETFFVPGILLQIWTWFYVVRDHKATKTGVRNYYWIIIALCAAVFASVLVWVVRPYFLSIMALSGFCTGAYVALHFRRSVPLRPPVFLLLAFVLASVPIAVKSIGQLDVFRAGSSSSMEFVRENSLAAQTNRPADPNDNILDVTIRTLNISRDSFEELNGASDLFGDIRFESVVDVVRFMPIALSISMLAPFPDAWFGLAKQPGGQMMRTVAAFEMLFGYFGLGFLFIRLVQGGLPSRLVGIVVVFSAVPMLIWGLAIPNVGTLYRFRAPLWMLLVLLGWAFAFQWLAVRQLHRDR